MPVACETFEVDLAHRQHFLLASIGCEPMQQVKAWQAYELTDVSAKVLIHEAFIGGKLDFQNALARAAHDLYFEPKYDELRFRVLCAFT